MVELYEQLAYQYDHSTASQAAEFAKKCNAGKLILGHFSSRYNREDWLLKDAVKHFPHTILADESLSIKIMDKTEESTLFAEWRS